MELILMDVCMAGDGGINSDGWSDIMQMITLV
jgi:hypothetical protein